MKLKKLLKIGKMPRLLTKNYGIKWIWLNYEIIIIPSISNA